MTLPNELLKSSNSVHFSRANASLRTAYNNSPSLRAKFSPAQQRDILAGNSPRNYTWHHHQNRGRMELVNKEIHKNTGHTGGRAIWELINNQS